MAKTRPIDLMDGFDGREIIYDDKKEKLFHSRIWFVLAAVAALVLALLLYRLAAETVYRFLGEQIEAEYCWETTKQYARYFDETGKMHTYNLSQFFSAEHDGDKIRLYYFDDFTQARPLTEAGVWIKYMGFFVVMLGICIWRLRVIWHPKLHAPAAAEQE